MFLTAALESIALQSDQAFTLYVGDDASPHDLAALCAPFAQRLRLNYVRFERNLGQTDLVAHWTRCIELSREPWVWLFSDDDVMDPECVGTLLDRIAGCPADADLFHFDVVQIDADGRDLRAAPPFPEEMSAMHFALARMERRISSYAPDYVFSRAAMQRVGGFQAFPVAWCSDDATWIKLAHRGGIQAVRGPKVRWRISSQNVSSASSPHAKQKLYAAVQFVQWLEQFMASHAPGPGDPSAEQVLAAARNWLYSQSHALKVGFWQHRGIEHSWRLRHCMPYGFLGAMLRTAVWDRRLPVAR